MSTLATKNVAAVLAAVALALGISFTFATPAKADAISDLQAQVQALLAQIAALQGTTGSTGGSMSASCHTFTRDQQQGDSGGEVMWIQQFLNGHGAQVSASGAGSPGNESSYFGAKTKAAVAKYQVAKGITPTAGYWGPKTRAAANADCAGSTTGGSTGGGSVTPTGPGITVSAATQPANSLAPKGAQRVPFTSFTLTNNSSAAVTVTGITVQRTGIAQDMNFSGVVLVDSNGLQIGVAHTFDSNHQTVVGDTMTLAPGASQTFTVAGNISSSNAQAGEVASISVVGVNTSAPVAGSLPITGAQQTINATLSLGSISIGSSAFDPGTPTTKHIGDTAIKFTGVRFTNSSTNEDAKFYSIRWRLNGSVGASDLANVVTIVNGTSYPTTLSADGRYYTTVFPGGILVGKGNNVDVYVQGDIVGTNASNRTAEFDIDRTSDVYFVGQVYGYGLGLTGTIGTYNTGSGHVTNADVSKQPWLVGSTVTVQGGTVTTIQNATNVPSQNIAVNVSNQPLGGFQTNFAGEPVTVQGMNFNITGLATSTAAGEQLTLISIVNENGSVVAGPVDAVAGVASFTNSVTFPTGLHTYTIQGKLPSDTANGGTIQLSTNPSSWTSPQGQLTGNSITISTPSFNMNTMTVRAAQLTIAAGTNPASQNVVAGGQNILMATVQLDASQSGEDVQLSSLPIVHTGTGNLGYLNNCQLWDGTTALNTGSDVLNTVATTSTITFTNGALRITKGTVKTLNFTCNLSSTANAGATYKFGVDSGSAPTVTGVTSGNTVTTASNNLVVNTTSSGTMTVSSGASVTATLDSSSPSYAVNAGGTTGVVMSVIKLRATNENVNLTKLGLTLANGSYLAKATGSGNQSNGASDLTQVYLYNSAGTLLGTATFTGSNTTATSTLNSPLLLTRDTDTTITVKADLANIGASMSGGIGNLVKVDPLNFEGTGVSSGSTIRGAASGTSAGVRLFKSYPTLALDTLPSTGVADGRLMHFKVTANSAGPIGISKFTFKVSTTSASVTNIDLYGFTDSSYSQAVSGQGTGGLIGTEVASAINGTAFTFTASPVLQVPAGQTYYFELRGAVSGVTTGSSVVTTLVGDAGFPTVNDVVNYNVATSSALSASNFVWSGNSTTTATTNDVDWSNGASIPGLPSSGIIQTRSN